MKAIVSNAKFSQETENSSCHFVSVEKKSYGRFNFSNEIEHIYKQNHI